MLNVSRVGKEIAQTTVRRSRNPLSSESAIATNKHARPASGKIVIAHGRRRRQAECIHWQEQEESLKMSTLSLPVANWCGIHWRRGHDDDERKPHAKCGQPSARSKWAGNCSGDNRRDVGVGFLRKPGKGSLHSRRLRGPDQLLHQVESLASPVEISDGLGGKSRCDGRSDASHNRDRSRNTSSHRSADAPGRVDSFSIPGQPLGIGVGHGVDLGAPGSGDGIAWGCAGAGRSGVGRRRLARAALAFVAVVVT